MGVRDGVGGNPFDAFHPSVTFAYLACAIALCMGAFHPVCAGISFVGALACSFVTRGARPTVRSLGWSVPMACAIAIANPLFTSSGSTLLFHIGARAVYLEALAYGAVAGCVFAAMILWFSCYAACMDSERSLSVAGRALPVVSLMVSQVLRLAPQLVKRGRSILSVQEAMSAGAPSGIRAAGKARMRVTSVLMGWAMEDGLVRSDAMRARGFGATARRTSYRRYRMRARDAAFLAIALALAAASAALVAVACARFAFYPRLDMPVLWWGYAPYASFVLAPAALYARERLAWRS